MGLNLKRQDYLLFVVAVLIAVVMGVWATTVSDIYSLHAITDYLPVPVTIFGLAFIYLSRSLWGGEVARFLEIVGVGLGILMLTWIPHGQWHFTGGPAWFQIPPPLWLFFFHFVTLGGFLMVTYGFYVFWRSGRG